jgi:hypothetical protein
MRAPTGPVGLYEPCTRCGSLVFLWAISFARDGQMITGKVCRDHSLGEAREAGRRAAENLLIVLSIAAELIIERLGRKGRHALTAIGCSTLPNNNAVTLEAIARVRD